MTAPHHQLRIPGREILREVVEAYQPFRERIVDRDTRVLIVRFTPGPTADDEWAARMQASAVSAQQKVRTFAALGAQVDNLALPDSVAAGELVDLIQAANDDPHVAAVIVQSPPPTRLRAVVDLIDPAKDIDALGVDSPRPACATADGIVRVAEPFLTSNTTVAVVGARGFVGGGVARLLRDRGRDPLALDDGDDLRQLREVDVVLSATGRPHLLTGEHLHRGHLLVVDSGFVPHPDGPRGDVAPDAARLPGAITPVPGGIGPVEMATLAERLTVQQAAPDLQPWRYLPPASDPPPAGDVPARASHPAPVTTARQVVDDVARRATAAPPGPQAAPAVGPPPGREDRRDLEPDDVEIEHDTQTAADRWPGPAVLPSEALRPDPTPGPPGPVASAELADPAGRVRDTLAELRRQLDGPRPPRPAADPARDPGAGSGPTAGPEPPRGLDAPGPDGPHLEP